MTARELLRHCFSWEIAPGIAAPEEPPAPEAPPAPDGAPALGGAQAPVGVAVRDAGIREDTRTAEGTVRR